MISRMIKVELPIRLKDPFARIQKELFHLTSTYTVTVYENTYADLTISLCVAIDYVEMLENSSK